MCIIYCVYFTFGFDLICIICEFGLFGLMISLDSFFFLLFYSFNSSFFLFFWGGGEQRWDYEHGQGRLLPYFTHAFVNLVHFVGRFFTRLSIGGGGGEEGDRWYGKTS